MVPRSWTTVFDLSAKRELNNGFGNALSTAVELAVTPAVMALIGWQIDRWLGTFPAFFLFLFVFTIGYVVLEAVHGLQRHDGPQAAGAARAEAHRDTAEDAP